MKTSTKIGVGNVGFFKFKWNWAPDKIDPARKQMIRPAKHFQNLYEFQLTNVNFTKFVQNLFRIILIKQ